MNRQRTIYLYSVVVVITLSLWIASKHSTDVIFKFPLKSFTQLTALFAAVMVGINFVLSARLPVVNRFFGGLDKAYRQHSLTGRIAFTLMVLHPTILVINALPDWSLVKQFILPSSFVPYLTGKLTLTLFTILLVFTIFIKLPYHIWQKTHQLMVIPLVVLIFHTLTITSDVSRYVPLKFWILTFLFTGLFFYIYKVFLYSRLAPRYLCRLVKITKNGKITEVLLEPESKRIEFNPGQFVFVKFLSDKVSDEEHPFTISSSPENKKVRLSIKKSGDFTSTLNKLRTGDKALVYGPYGEFGDRVFSNNKKNVFIAGGIGITPFLSILNYIVDNKLKKNVILYYVCRGDEDAVYKKELFSLSKKTKNLKVVFYNSAKKERFTIKHINKVKTKRKDKQFFICGPKSMIDDIKNRLASVKVDEKNIILEEFSLKT